MTDDQINVAIAEACGWKRGPMTERLRSFYGTPATQAWYPPSGNPNIYTPNYCNDLNAMHEVEKTLNNDEAEKYVRWLHTLVHSPMPYESMELVEQQDVIMTTARQRAEAFLRVKGLWKE